jgi:hypothetical protein
VLDSIKWPSKPAKKGHFLGTFAFKEQQFFSDRCVYPYVLKTTPFALYVGFEHSYLR